MKKKKVIIISAIAVAIVALIVVIAVIAGKGDKKKSYRVVKVEECKGSTLVNRSKKDIDAFKDMQLSSGDKVSVADESRLVLLVDSDKHMVAEENTKFELKATGSDKKGNVTINLIEGDSLYTIDNKLNDNSSFKVTTNNATFSVRGTQFRVIYDAKKDMTFLKVTDGVVHTEYEDGYDSEDVTPGEIRVITDEKVYKELDDAAIEEFVIEYELDSIDADSDTSANDDTTPGDSIASEEGSAVVSTPGLAGRYSAYQDVVSNYTAFIENNTSLRKDYYVNDYMYFDYDHDGVRELILSPSYRVEDGEEYVDVIYLDYNETNQKVCIVGVVENDAKNSSFYAEYKGNLVRYSFITDPYESYIYSVGLTDDGRIIYVLEESLDEVISDLEGKGMHPLPLYGDWELVPTDE